MRQGVAEHIEAVGFDPGPEEDCGDGELGRLWSDLAYRPAAWVFGHFHKAHHATVDGTEFVCIADDLSSQERALEIWDTEEKLLLRCPADPSLGPLPADRSE